MVVRPIYMPGLSYFEDIQFINIFFFFLGGGTGELEDEDLELDHDHTHDLLVPFAIYPLEAPIKSISKTASSVSFLHGINTRLNSLHKLNVFPADS